MRRECWMLCGVLLGLLSAVAAEPPVVIPGIPTGKDGAGFTTTRFGDGYITRGPNGQSYTTSRFGDGWITRGPNGQTWTSSSFGDGSIVRGPGGKQATVSQFGDGYITRTTGGTDFTTQPFGDGTITRGASGGSVRTQTFGDGYRTEATGSRGQGSHDKTILVLPVPTRSKVEPVQSTTKSDRTTPTPSARPLASPGSRFPSPSPSVAQKK